MSVSPATSPFASLLSQDDPTLVLHLQEEIAAGAYGSVYVGTFIPTQEVVAVKICPVEDEESMTDLFHEIAILKKFNSPKVVKFFGAWKKENELWIGMEYCGGGSVNTLFEVLEDPLSEKDISYILKETLEGLIYIHSQGVIHRDIKSPNILMTVTGEIKLADFGVSAILQTLTERRTTFIGTPWWMAPEIIIGARTLR
eukprot:TRINITY_DN7408_c0_g1_i1.p1 TRINITY_DN7408_c0_g1~~TRINITY_DN7408_c0_g1_i1.p1  ORF type:complete len:199 (+),score=41.89 TRINITY_DN7408_c0_g1_i1:85-681(+)